MENITIGDIAAAIGTIGVIAASLWRVHLVINKASDDRKEMLNLIENIDHRIDAVELDNDKNFLVWFLSDIEQGKPLDEVEYERFYETFDRYTKKGHNGYIKHKVEILQKSGKLK